MNDTIDKKVTYLSMPDPCPHVSRIDIIAARLNGEPLPKCEECGLSWD